MVIYQGMIPALKYMVNMMKRYHSFLFHMVSLVNIYPRKAAISTVRAVPMNVLATEILAACSSPGIWMALT